MVRTGFRDFIGSWKTMAIRDPRMRRARTSSMPRMSSPSRVIASAVTSPGGLVTSFMMESAVTLLPEPLSPTIPSTFPGMRSNETPPTAWTVPSSV